MVICRSLTLAGQPMLSQGFLGPPRLSLCSLHPPHSSGAISLLQRELVAFCSVLADVWVTTAAGIINTSSITYTRKHPHGKLSHRVNPEALLVI